VAAGERQLRTHPDARSEVAWSNTRRVPGMPAEMLMLTGGRAKISCLFKPFDDRLSRMFRER
jgi:hypothetical protein